MADKNTLVVSYWYEPKTKELVFDWPTNLSGVTPRIAIDVPNTPEFANTTHIEVFKAAKNIISAQHLIARLNYKGNVELNPLQTKPKPVQEAKQLPLL
jgi:hypothetical protein